MKKAILYLTIITLLCTTEKVFAQQFKGPQKDIEKILQSKKDFSKNFKEQNTKILSYRYTEDAKLFNNDGVIKGYKAYESKYTLPNHIKIISHKITPNEIVVEGNIAYAYGTFEGKFIKNGTTEIVSKGSYMNVWKKINGEWKVYIEMSK